jgi:NAD(P)-dependent dehydrogenase (short-subunit alcohol dehydrogenase family)
MNLGLEGKTALVTGAGRGIGRSICSELAREGVRVLGVSRNRSDLEQMKDDLSNQQVNHAIREIDLEDPRSVPLLMKSMRDIGFFPDIVIHNVGGTLNISDPFCAVSDWNRVMRLNFEIAVEINSAVLPRLMENGWGRVVHVSSISAMENHGPVPYCAAKAALTAYTRSMGGVVAPNGVVMSAVLPGAVYTEGGFWDEASVNRPEHVRKYLTERQRIGRFGRVEEIGHYVTFLCSELASFSTGSIVPIDGGQGRGYFGQ